MTIYKITKYFALLALLLVSVPAHALHLRSRDAGVDLTTEKVTHLYGTVDADNSGRFIDEVNATMNLPGPRIVLINSPGGYKHYGDDLIAIMEMERARGVKQVCVVIGGASSMAFNLLTHCDVRLAVKDAHFLVHKVFYESFPPEVKITAVNLRLLADTLDQDDAPYRRRNAAAMHMTLPDYDRAADAETEWTASQLRAMRYLDGFVKLRQ